MTKDCEDGNLVVIFLGHLDCHHNWKRVDRFEFRRREMLHRWLAANIQEVQLFRSHLGWSHGGKALKDYFLLGRSIFRGELLNFRGVGSMRLILVTVLHHEQMGWFWVEHRLYLVIITRTLRKLYFPQTEGSSITKEPRSFNLGKFNELLLKCQVTCTSTKHSDMINLPIIMAVAWNVVMGSHVTLRSCNPDEASIKPSPA